MSGSWSNNAVTELTIPTGATSGERIEIMGNAITAFYADNRVAWQGQTDPVSALIDYSDDDPSTVQATALTNGQLVMFGAPVDQDDFTRTVSFLQRFDESPNRLQVTMTDASGDSSTMNLVYDPVSGAMWWELDSASATVVGAAGAPAFTSAFKSGAFANETLLQYELDPLDNLAMVGGFSAATAIAAASTTTVFTLDAASRPKKGVRFPIYQSTGAAGSVAFLVVQPGGAVILLNPTAAAVGAVFEFDERLIPMGHRP